MVEVGEVVGEVDLVLEGVELEVIVVRVDFLVEQNFFVKRFEPFF